MESPLQSLLEQIKAAREQKGLSQSALGKRVGLPQSHISKIETGGVDLQASSLLEIARALDLELILVPRVAIPAVRVIQQEVQRRGTQVRDSIAQRVPASQRQRPAYSLDDEDEGSDG